MATNLYLVQYFQLVVFSIYSVPLLKIITLLRIHYTKKKTIKVQQIKFQEHFCFLIDQKNYGALYNCNGHGSNGHVGPSGLQMAGKSLHQMSQEAKFCCHYTEIDGVGQLCLRAIWPIDYSGNCANACLSQFKYSILRTRILSHLHWQGPFEVMLLG